MWKAKGKPDRRQALFGGKGEVRVWSLADAVPSPFNCVLGCELDPRGSVGTHRQEECAEVLIVTEGQGEAVVGGAKMALRPGVTISLSLGQTLALANRSARGPLRYLIIKAS